MRKVLHFGLLLSFTFWGCDSEDNGNSQSGGETGGDIGGIAGGQQGGDPGGDPGGMGGQQGGQQGGDMGGEIISMTQCNDGIDNDQDELIDLFDPDCVNNQDQQEDNMRVETVCSQCSVRDNAQDRAQHRCGQHWWSGRLRLVAVSLGWALMGSLTCSHCKTAINLRRPLHFPDTTCSCIRGDWARPTAVIHRVPVSTKIT